MDKHITAPITKETARYLHAGDYVYVTGTIYTARDAAHKRMDEALDRGESLPIDIKDQAIYYMGPSPAREDARSDQPDRQPPAVWTSMHHVCWISVRRP